MNKEPVVDDSIGSLTFDLLLTVVVVVVVVVVAVVPSTVHKMKPVVFLSRLFLTAFTKLEVHNVTYSV